MPPQKLSDKPLTPSQQKLVEDNLGLVDKYIGYICTLYSVKIDSEKGDEMRSILYGSLMTSASKFDARYRRTFSSFVLDGFRTAGRKHAYPYKNRSKPEPEQLFEPNNVIEEPKETRKILDTDKILSVLFDLKLTDRTRYYITLRYGRRYSTAAIAGLMGLKGPSGTTYYQTLVREALVIYCKLNDLGLEDFMLETEAPPAETDEFFIPTLELLKRKEDFNANNAH